MTQITVAEIIAPAPGKKQYKVIDMAGQQWGVWADHIQDYSVGATYNILQQKSSVFKGTTYYTIEEVEFVGMDIPQTQQRQAPPARQQAVPVQRRTVAPRVNGPAGVAYSPRQPSGNADKTRSMEIFVCGGLNNMLSNPNVVPQDLTVQQLIGMVTNLTTAWRNTLGKEQRDDAMDEEIPI